MAIRVSGAFVTRFNEALRATGTECSCAFEHRADPIDLTHRQVEDLLDRMKYDLAAVLLAPGAGALEINVPDRTNMLDSESPAT